MQGAPVKARVSSLREVDWSRFNLNFFLVFSPGVLEAAPGFHVVTTRTFSPAASGVLQRELVADFPNVTAIDLTQILQTVAEILSKIGLVVTVLGGFTLLVGLPILIGTLLIGTLLNGRDVRLRESVLLRTLGASAKQVRMILIVEYATLGLLSALTGILAGEFLLVTGISILAGLALSRGVCHHPPLEILRGA